MRAAVVFRRKKRTKRTEEATAIAKSSESSVSESLVYWLVPSETFEKSKRILLNCSSTRCKELNRLKIYLLTDL